MQNRISVRKLETYSKCPRYFYYRRRLPTLTPSLNNIQKCTIAVIKDCYQELAIHEKKVTWRTLRNRVNERFTQSLPADASYEVMYSRIKMGLQQIRNWYLGHFRDGPGTCLNALKLHGPVPGSGRSLYGEVDIVTLRSNSVSLIEISNVYKSKFQFENSIAIRAKIWLLNQQGIKVDSYSLVYVNENGTINVYKIDIKDYDEFIYRIENTIKMIIAGISSDIYYPSQSEMCNTCKYRNICSW